MILQALRQHFIGGLLSGICQGALDLEFRMSISLLSPREWNVPVAIGRNIPCVHIRLTPATRHPARQSCQ
jgi:hypothetical protein